MTAFRNLGVCAFADLVRGFQTAIAAPAQRDARAGGVQQPFVRNIHRHGRLVERGPAVPDARECFVELCGEQFQ